MKRSAGPCAFNSVGGSAFYDPDGRGLAVASAEGWSIVTSDEMKAGLGKLVTSTTGIPLDLSQVCASRRSGSSQEWDGERHGGFGNRTNE